jgi:hypothetical protein
MYVDDTRAIRVAQDSGGHGGITAVNFLIYGIADADGVSS